MAILEVNSIFFPDRVDEIINHPDGGEEEEDYEEDLQVSAADVHLIVGTAANQDAAQDQNVHTNDPRQNPAPVSTRLLQDSSGRNVGVGLARALHLTRYNYVVGQVNLLRLLVFGRHPAWFRGIAGLQTHPSLCLRPIDK